MSFVETLINYLDYDRLSKDRASVYAIAYQCVTSNQLPTGELMDRLVDHDLIDGEMVSELTQEYGVSMYRFPRKLLKGEHLLSLLSDSDGCPSQLSDFSDLMTPELVKQLLEKNFNALPFLPSEMVDLEQVLAYLKKTYPNQHLDLETVKKICQKWRGEMGEILEYPFYGAPQSLPTIDSYIV